MNRFLAALVLAAELALPQSELRAQRQMEPLGRGVVAIRQADNAVFVGWRLLRTDPADIAFNLYRKTGEAEPVRLNDQQITTATHFVDRAAEIDKTNAYFVRPVLRDKEQAEECHAHGLAWACVQPLNAKSPARPYLSIPLQTLAGHRPGDASVGDLDGDGEYEIIVKQEERPRDNSQRGRTGQTKLEAYKLDGTMLWRIDLGKNIREGAHYTQFIVYDVDGDGRAEVACKTADGTLDGQQKPIGDPAADHRNSVGYILTGPEFLTIFDGKSGAALATAPYVPSRGNVAAWGDDYGNRVDRFLACVAYLDGRRPSLVMCRGYYTRAVLAAWNWRDGKLTNVWTFDTDAPAAAAQPDYRGQGNHNLAVGDVDRDGRDEIVYGACCIDDNGKGLYTTKLGHGDAIHLADIDPDRPGLEIFGIHERPRHPHAIDLHDAASGKILWSAPSTDVGRGIAMDIDPRHRGYECWAAGDGLSAIYNCKGQKIPGPKPRSCNMGVWWDGDPLRELLDGTRIEKWDHQHGRSELILSAADHDCAANNGSKANPCLCADILGDWREEVIWRTRDNRELRIFTTTIPTTRRLPTLMHDPIYRNSVAWQNIAYNQPTQTSFYLGHEMPDPPRPAIQTTPNPTTSKP